MHGAPPQWASCAAGLLQGPERPARLAERQEVEMSHFYTALARGWSPTLRLIELSVTCVLGYEGSKSRGCRDPKKGVCFPFLVLPVF